MVDPEVVRRRVLARLHGSDPDWDEDDLPPLPGERESGYRAETERHDAVGVASNGAGTVAGVAPRSGARRGAQRVAFGRRVPEPGASSGNGRAGRENRPPRQSQPLRASPSAESSGASVRSRDVPLGTRGDPRGPDRAARPATSSSQRGQSLSLLKREHAARPSPAHRRDPDAPTHAESDSVHRPRFQNSHTQVYNRLLAESAARRARAPRPRDDEGGADHGTDDDDEWRVRFDEPHAPPPHPRPRAAVDASSKNTTEDEGGGYWGATEPEEGGNTDAYDVPSPGRLAADRDRGGGARRSRRRGAGADARAPTVAPPREESRSADGLDEDDDDDDGDAMSTGEEEEPSDDAFDETGGDTGSDDAAVGDDIGTLPRTVDVLGALRGDNLELRDKLREATEMLSRVSEERAAATRQRTLLQRQLKEATATRERLREREAAAERARREAAEAGGAAEARAKAAEKKLEKLANAKKAALEAESRTVRAESRISALEMELASMRERVERAEEERDEAKAETKAMAVWRIEEDEKARSGDHAALVAAAEEAELILAPFSGEDADTDIDAILSPQAKSGPGRIDEDEIRSTHPLAAIAARAAANMERRESRLSSLLSALTGEMAASKRAEKEISQLRKRVAESETAAAAAIGALERERVNAGRGFSSTRGGDVEAAGVAAPATPSARDVASMAVGLASSAKSRVRDAEEELRAANARIEAAARENASLESRLERSERLRAGLRLAADASEAMTEQLAELEAANGKLRDECMATSRVALHLHRRWRMARLDRWAEGKARGMSSFGADLRDAKAAVFFCFKFWRELSKGDAPERGPSAAAGRRSSVEEEKNAEDGFTFAPPSPPRGEDAFTPPAAGGGPTPFKDLNPFAKK